MTGQTKNTVINHMQAIELAELGMSPSLITKAFPLPGTKKSAINEFNINRSHRFRLGFIWMNNKDGFKVANILTNLYRRTSNNSDFSGPIIASDIAATWEIAMLQHSYVFNNAHCDIDRFLHLIRAIVSHDVIQRKCDCCNNDLYYHHHYPKSTCWVCQESNSRKSRKKASNDNQGEIATILVEESQPQFVPKKIAV